MPPPLRPTHGPTGGRRAPPADRRLPMDKLITHRLPLERFQEGIALVNKSAESCGQGFTCDSITSRDRAMGLPWE